MVKGFKYQGNLSLLNHKWFIPISLYVIASILIFYIGLLYYQQSKKQVLDEATVQLEILSSIKLSEISEWFLEREKDISFYRNNRYFRNEVNRFFESSDQNVSILADWLSQTQKSHGYDIFIIDKSGKSYFITGNDSTDLSDFIIDSCVNNIQKDKMIFLDIYRRKNTDMLFHSTMAPLRLKSNKAPEACLVFRSDVQKHLIGKVVNNDYQTKLFSYTLIRNEGDSVYFVNGEKYKNLSDLASGNVKKMDKSPFVQAAQGKTGIQRGIGLKNEELLSSIGKIPSSQWYLVVHSDIDNILAPLSDRKWSIIGFGLLAVVIFIIYHLRYVIAVKNKRLEQVIDLYREINSLNQNLEKRVEERTEQIENLNKSLESRANQLEILNKELESFTYSVSHDLKAPLRAIQGFSDIILKEHMASVDEEVKRLMTIIHKNAKRMDQLIKDLLDLSKISRINISFKPLNMNAIIADVITNEYPDLNTSKIKIEIKTLLPSKGDHVLVRQVWTNLLSNAIKYSHKKDLSQITIDSAPINGFIEYSIRDNGAGFNPAYSDKLFVIFQRLHSREEFEGTGVGLAIVKRILQKHGGDIRAEGKEEEGAVFYFTLPKSF